MKNLALRRWIVTQIGARQHYTVPAGFEHLGQLERFYTDVWCTRGSSLLRRMGGPLRDFAGRNSRYVPAAKVVSFTRHAIRQAWSSPRKVGITARYEHYIATGREFALRVNRHLQRRLARSGELACFAFNTGCLETIPLLQANGIPVVVDQIDPARVEEQIVLEECRRWPEWEAAPGCAPAAYFERLQAEWTQADVVFVNSEWCRSALVQQGVPGEKIAVAPIAYGDGDRPTSAAAPREATDNGPLRVLWLGQVNLRKGIPYLLEAARLLSSFPVQFRVVGSLSISEAAMRTAPANVQFDGPVARVDAADAYRWADVFVLPTLSDGFAITQLEAMSHGLPVITTPNCGEVVMDGDDGLIVPIRDAEALARAIVRLGEDRKLLSAMSERARMKVREFSMQRVAQRRLDAICRTYSLERHDAPVGTCR